MFAFIKKLRMTFQTGVAWDLGSASDWLYRVESLILIILMLKGAILSELLFNKSEALPRPRSG